MLKKYRYFVFIGIFIIVTVILCNGKRENVPIKNENFKAPEQIISLINNNDIKVIDKDGNYVNTKIYNECLSYRKRVAGDNLDYSRLKLKKCSNFKLKDKNKIINNYKKDYKNLKNLKVPKEIKVEKYTGTAKNNFYYNNKKKEENIELIIIFIKENNGYVIDRYSLNDVNNKDYNNNDFVQ